MKLTQLDSAETIKNKSLLHGHHFSTDNLSSSVHLYQYLFYKKSEAHGTTNNWRKNFSKEIAY